MEKFTPLILMKYKNISILVWQSKNMTNGGFKSMGDEIS